MKLGFIGVGALGSLFGGALADAGHNVTLVIRNEAHRKAVCHSGLRLVRDSGESIVKIPTITPTEIHEPFDAIFVFTKTGASAESIRAVSHMIDDATCLVSVQNGLGNHDLLAGFVGYERVIYGTTTAPADLLGPGHVVSHGQHLTQINAARADSAKIAAQLAMMLTGADMPTVVNDDIDAVIWSKVAFNTAINAICALVKGTPGTVADSAYLSNLARTVVMESCAVAQADGIMIDPQNVLAIIEMAGREHRTHKPSMVHDVMAMRQTEIDALNGAVIALGKKHNIATPLNEALFALIKGVEAQYEKNH
ncbi:ketopantoate reductase family protein [Candidatus Puniceispirillum marinum]|uniref:2-dehydropantoate 2-reductase n=1 Tax=Puniceispirillum marinum (strain IMCC1322) TaxID=488538 RepID=D5BQ06_PUNMI|nr:2-dehydropantoate 2-reductase [Candidatus Puniceispirillum marinum]ADE38504.1 2-dehydropantoate 2-reductase [Candidatus Puniceispirillum marinum IMCC1322]